jgi:thiamine biosynthesis lipoprotein
VSRRRAAAALLAALACAAAAACGTTQAPHSTPAVADICCATQAPQPPLAVARSGQLVMGTVLTVTVMAADEDQARRLADEAIAEARRWDDVLTIWRPEGELARFNARAGEGAVTVSASLAEGLSAMLRLAKETGGAFDPSVGTAARDAALPTEPRLVDSGKQTPPAASAGLAEVLRVNGVSASLEAGASLDPGAIGKGIALDAAAKLLRRGGAAAAFLDFGGSSQLAIGAPPRDPSGWKVAVSGLAAGTSHGVLHLKDASLSTSRAGALDTAPIVDPRSGAVVVPPRLATVLAPDATSADAWSTALVVLGADGAGDASAKGLEVLLEDGSGRWSSAGFRLGAPEKFPLREDSY